MAGTVTTKDFRTIIYDKTEVDTKISKLETTVNAELAKKLEISDVGSPTSAAKLDPSGLLENSQIPFATSQDASSGTSESLVINPKLLKQEIKAYSPKLDDKGTYILSPKDIQVPKQTLGTTEAELDADNRLITVSNSFAIEKSLKAYVDTNFMPLITNGKFELSADNPTMEMKVKDAGIAAQMSVIDESTGHSVASMEWIKSTQSFMFALNDKDSGITKLQFEMKLDGTIQINGKRVLSEDIMPQPPTADGEYKLVVANGSPSWVKI
jgi:hypothetical protein